MATWLLARPGIYLTYSGDTGVTLLGAAGITTDFNAAFSVAGSSTNFGTASSFPTFT